MFCLIILIFYFVVLISSILNNCNCFEFLKLFGIKNKLVFVFNFKVFFCIRVCFIRLSVDRLLDL